jgi:serine/threonine protein kinase
MLNKSLGRYEIQSEIGRGGMASVYLAIDPHFRRLIAIKVLSPQFLEHPVLRARFEREARLIATLEHPNIVPVYDYGEQDGQLYLVMRNMIGGALSARLHNGPLPLASAIQILSQLGLALDIVHARGVVHRDLKPGNILYDGFDNPALADFGIAYFAEATAQLTGDAIIGTPAYMSPEQVQGAVEIDGRSDIYALGVIFYEMLTGRQPFRSATPMSTALKHLSEPVPRIRINNPDLPAELDDILAKVMAKDREKRYQKASELVLDLRHLLEISSPQHITGSGSEQVLSSDILTQTGTGTRTEVTDVEGSQPAVPSGADPLLAARLPEVTSSEAISSGSAISIQKPPSPVTETGTRQDRPPNRPVRPASSSRLAGFLSLGLIGFALAGLGSLIIFAGLIYFLVIRPAAGSPPTPDPQTAALSATATNPLPAARVPIFSDDFSQPAYGWPQSQDDRASYSYQDGAYRIIVHPTDTLFWVTPDGSFADISISVSTNLVSGSDESYYGLICHLQNNQEFYYMVIRVDGNYTIGKYQNGDYQSLLPGGWTYSQAIHLGTDQNQLRADCAGGQIRFFANGELLAEAQDDSFSEGKAGLAAAAIGYGDLNVLFDNFLVTEP